MRPEKASIVSDLSEKLNRSPFVLVTDYQRMNVNHFADLRNRLAASGAEVHVVKNSFLKRAMTNSGLPDVADKLSGQTAVVTGEKDVAPVAKILKSFLAEFKIAALKIGVIDKSILSTQELETLAELPSREVLLAQLLGLLMAPATKLVRLLNEPGSALARVLNAKASTMPAEPTQPEVPPTEASKEETAKAETAAVAETTKEEAPKIEAATEKVTAPEPAAEDKQEAVAEETIQEKAPAVEATKEEVPSVEVTKEETLQAESAAEKAPAVDVAKEEK
jgi:large subunit ribosomal protein L10